MVQSCGAELQSCGAELRLLLHRSVARRARPVPEHDQAARLAGGRDSVRGKGGLRVRVRVEVRVRVRVGLGLGLAPGSEAGLGLGQCWLGSGLGQ